MANQSCNLTAENHYVTNYTLGDPDTLGSKSSPRGTVALSSIIFNQKEKSKLLSRELKQLQTRLDKLEMIQTEKLSKFQSKNKLQSDPEYLNLLLEGYQKNYGVFKDLFAILQPRC